MAFRRTYALALMLAVGCGAPADKPGNVTNPQMSATSRLVTLQTVVKHMFLVAEKGGGNVVNANRAVAKRWETFTLIDLDGGALRDGDLVQVAAFNGQFVTAENGGGGAVLANRDVAGPAETFALEQAGDAVHLRTVVTKQYLSALNGGGGSLLANANKADGWESFRLGDPGD
jgi:hypothetical protein